MRSVPKASDVLLPSRLGFAWIGLAVACVIGPEGPQLPGPDPSLVYVFFPSGDRVADGLVRGRGLPGAMPSSLAVVRVESFPTGHRVFAEVEPDGSFEFQVRALSGEVLEIRGLTARDRGPAGAPLFVEVPATIAPFVPHVCCAATSRCQTIYERERDQEAGLECEETTTVPEPGVVRCNRDRDCAQFENEYYEFPEGSLQVSQPNADGRIDVAGRVLPNMLVTLANVGKRAFAGGLDPEEAQRIGLLDPGVRLTQISDAEGRFRFASLPAIADDEVIVQYFDLNGYRSPPYAARVPDPPLEGVDVTSVFPWAPLTNGEDGIIAIRVSPYGRDGRGICPDDRLPTDGLELCVGGGLNHGMIEGFGQAQLDFPDDRDFALDPRPARTSASLPYNRGVEGNVQSGPLDIALVVDTSAGAADQDPNRFLIEGLRSYVRFLRARDRVSVFTTGGGVERVLDPTTDRAAADRVLADLARSSGEGSSALLPAVIAAAEGLGQRGTRSESLILVALGALPGPADAALLDRALTAVERRPGSRRGHRVDVVMTTSDGAFPEAIEDLATFSRGRLVGVESPGEFEQALANLRGEQVGSFLLLYDVKIPVAVGKAAEVILEFGVRLPDGTTRNARYRGPIFVANAP